MNQMTDAMMELANMDALANMDSPIHRRHPLGKMLLTVLYIFLVVSYPKEQLSAMLPMLFYPILLFQFGGITMRTCFYKMRYILPLVCAVGIWNPFIDRVQILQIGNVVITRGMITFVTLLLKGFFSVMASFLLIATTGIEQICYALNLLKVPDILVTQILITYRYISLLLEEAQTMINAYALRAPGQNGLHISSWGSFVGQLLIRSMDRAGELYQSMQMRGFTGSFYYAKKQSWKKEDFLYLFIWSMVLVVFRLVNIPVVVGNLFL